MTSSLLPNRRQTIAGAAALAGATLAPGFAFAQSPAVPMADLMAANALPDIWLGKADAKVTIIEYASMTCPHCATFHGKTFKELKKKYIDAGKVRFTLREFPFDPLAMAGFMLARCQGEEKREAMVELLFEKQRDWVNDKPFEGLTSLTKQAGMSEEAFKKCLDDKELYGKLSDIRDRASQKFGVTSTPTFFVNGVKLTGDLPLADFEKVMEPMLK